MPVNKNAGFRYRAIDHLLRQSRTGLSMMELVKLVGEMLSDEFGIETGVSESTLRKDINVMRSDPPRGYGAPIVCEQGKYSYNDPEYSIFRLPLSENDRMSLYKAHALMRSVSGMPFSEMLAGLIAKLRGSKESFEGMVLPQINVSAKMSYTHHLDVLIDAVLEGQKVKFDYHPFGRQVMPGLEVDPWLLKEFNGRWFLVGKSIHRDGVSVFGIDRIHALVVMEQSFQRPSHEELQRYSDVIGLSYPDGAVKERIVLRFRNERAWYVETKPIHSSQVCISKNNTHAEFLLHLVINKELISLIHYYGPDVEVLEPNHLRDTIARDIKSIYELYNKDQQPEKGTAGSGRTTAIPKGC